MFSGSEPELSWALFKAALIIGSSVAFVVGLVWVAAKKTFPK